MLQVKFICIALSFFFVSEIAAQNVNNFHFATWNSHGGKWPAVLEFIKDGSLDALIIQEAGSLPHEGRNTLGSISSVGSFLPLTYVDYVATNTEADLIVEEYLWTVNGNKFYIYLYDRRLRLEPLEKVRDHYSSLNTMIVTKQRGTRVFLLPAIDKGGAFIAPTSSLYTVNRPVIGVQLQNAIFFNLHAQPVDTKNEAAAVVNKLQTFMQNNYPTLTWVVAGDFNRIPSSVTGLVNAAPANRFIELLSSGTITHPSTGKGRSAELDYGYWGGPAANRVAFSNVQLLNDYIYTVHRRHVSHDSDHLPVRFN